MTEEGTTVRAEFDQQNPPAQPPRGADPLLWRLSYQVWTDHQPAVDQFCQAGACRDAFRPWPCPPRRFAMVGLLAAAGSRAPWASLNRAGHLR
ncbi:hypothetical protein HC028_05230 [Planosporangium flavigriseum]|uniref:hypothetical protein n=1 Tax=Planosporangium flavigriseum TaxID=373681 RepID=UPI00143A3538|nr:hypothetical protein [Planosporangium flavigriseum]NJC63912.1 hypothetical protein [Planosporangium flavigriseum]